MLIGVESWKYDWVGLIPSKVEHKGQYVVQRRRHEHTKIKYECIDLIAYNRDIITETRRSLDAATM